MHVGRHERIVSPDELAQLVFEFELLEGDRGSVGRGFPNLLACGDAGEQLQKPGDPSALRHDGYFSLNIAATGQNKLFSYKHQLLDKIQGTTVPEILIIEDEEIIRATLQQMLARAKHNVTATATGVEGLALMDRRSFDLVIVDMIMPDKDGIETIIDIRHRWPEARILAISGGGRTRNMDFLRYARSVGANAILPKPFTNADLTKAVAEALAA
ncbi:MAG: response regulator [Rhodospirillales bacterium]|nr:response regulator [Rhodospirillales bacterium]